MSVTELPPSELSNCLEALDHSNDFQVLRRLKPTTAYLTTPSSGKVHKVCIIDTETTGLDTQQCEIIELGYQIIEFDSQGKLYKVLAAKNFLNEPEGEITAEVTQVTGLTFADVEGHQIPWQEVQADLADVTLCVAHNAGFDRPVLERYDPLFVDKIWGCSVQQIDWQAITDVSSRSQEFLCWKIGQFFYDAHRALDDVQALSQLLSLEIGADKKPALSFLLQAVRQSKVIVKATGAPFDVKDELRKRGYRWNADARVWQKMMDEQRLEEEKVWLSANSTPNPTVIKLNANDSFSVRAQ